MKLVCTHKCFLLGRSIKSGEVVEIPEALLEKDNVKSSFATPEEVEVAEKAAEADRSDLSATEYSRRLEDAGVAVPPKATRAELKKLYVATFAPRKEAKVDAKPSKK